MAIGGIRKLVGKLDELGETARRAPAPSTVEHIDLADTPLPADDAAFDVLSDMDDLRAQARSLEGQISAELTDPNASKAAVKEANDALKADIATFFGEGETAKAIENLSQYGSPEDFMHLGSAKIKELSKLVDEGEISLSDLQAEFRAPIEIGPPPKEAKVLTWTEGKVVEEFPELEELLPYVNPDNLGGLYGDLQLGKISDEDFKEAIIKEGEGNKKDLTTMLKGSQGIPQSGDIESGLLYADIPQDVEIAQGNMQTLFVNPVTDQPLKEVDMGLFPDEAVVKLNNLLTKDKITNDEAQSYVNVTMKDAAGETPTDDEFEDYMQIVDMFENEAIFNIPTEHIDLDKLWFGTQMQTVPVRLEEMTFYEQTPDWIYELDPQKTKAMTAMAFVRGEDIFHVADDIVPQNYSHAHRGMEPHFGDAQYPSYEVYQQQDAFDIAAINFYTKAGDGPMNDALRRQEVEPGSDMEAAIQATTNALDKLPSWKPEDGLLYRRVNDRNLKELYENMPIGQEYTELAFMSTTRRAYFNIENTDPNANDTLSALNFVIKTKENGAAKPIEGMAHPPFMAPEREVLYKPGTRFRITHMEKRSTPGTHPIENLVVFIEEI